jgi:uncharacterized protein (TIGR02147 family)
MCLQAWGQYMLRRVFVPYQSSKIITVFIIICNEMILNTCILYSMTIFEYRDYRPFIRDYIASLPGRGRGEINRIATYIGVHPSLLSQTLSDSKNLNLEQVQLIGEYLRLTPPETDYLLCLAEYQRAGTPKLKRYFHERLEQQKAISSELSQRVRQDAQLSEEEKSIFYSHWAYAAAWLATSLHGGSPLEEITATLNFERERCVEILNFLVRTQLCVLKAGRYSMGPQSVHLARGSAHLPRHHTNWRLRAIEASDKISVEELMYTAPISISSEDFRKIRERLAEVIKEVTEIAIPSEAEEIVCFNIDFFRFKS